MEQRIPCPVSETTPSFLAINSASRSCLWIIKFCSISSSLAFLSAVVTSEEIASAAFPYRINISFYI